MKQLLYGIACFFSVVFVSQQALANKMNFRFGPVGVVFGTFNANLDIAMAPQWTLGPELSYRDITASSGPPFTSDYHLTALELGARANWFPRGIYRDGWYIGPSLGFATVNISTTDSGGSTSGGLSGLYMGCVGGYGWFWKHFNMMFGGGLTLGFGDTKVPVIDSSGGTTYVTTEVNAFDIEYSLGWAFN